MATNTKKKSEKDIKDIERELLLTEEEYAKKARQKTKDTMNRVLRVVGLVASFILIYAGLFDPVFELSYFGWMADGIMKTTYHKDAWTFLGPVREINGVLVGTAIYDDPMQFGLWLPKLGLTIVLIAAVVGTAYLLVYNVVDIIALVKTFMTGTHEITKDLTTTVKDTVLEDKDLKIKKRPKKNLFEDSENLFSDEKSKKSKGTKKKDEPVVEFGGYTEDELDRLLSGEVIDAPAENGEKTLEEPEKNLFRD